MFVKKEEITKKGNITITREYYALESVYESHFNTCKDSEEFIRDEDDDVSDNCETPY